MRQVIIMTEFENKLVLDHLQLVDKVIRTRITFRSSSVLMSYEDLQGVGRVALCRAAMQYKPQLGSFEPFAARCIYNAIIDHCRAENVILKSTISETGDGTEETLLDRVSADTPDCESVIDAVTVEQLLRDFKDKYSGVARLGIEAIELKLLGFSSKEIAERYGTTVNSINAWISRARSKLKKEVSLVRLMM